MMDTKQIFLLVDGCTKRPLRHRNGKLAIYSKSEIAKNHTSEWTSTHGSALAQIVELKVNKAFKFYNTNGA